MKKHILALVLTLSFLLGGCGAWLDGSYVSITPHQEQTSPMEEGLIEVSTYIELRNVLADMVENGVENGMISVEAFEQSQVESKMDMAVRYVRENNPIGAYAVANIAYEHGTSAGRRAVSVSITYNHGRAEILHIKKVNGVENAKKAIGDTLDRCEAGIVLLVSNYQEVDIAQAVEDYAALNPDMVMETPQTTVNIYPDLGSVRVVELTFTYQNSRDTLRMMQTRVLPIFSSAALYVSGDGADNEKYSQLYSFIMERYDYSYETSITPAYSLLRYGVGDCRAFALTYSAMCRQAGLECQVVFGTLNGEPWAWNIVSDDGVYYHVDMLSCNQGSGFCERTDEEMDGYVWDYSAYPHCG